MKVFDIDMMQEHKTPRLIHTYRFMFRIKSKPAEVFIDYCTGSLEMIQARIKELQSDDDVISCAVVYQSSIDLNAVEKVIPIKSEENVVEEVE